MAPQRNATQPFNVSGDAGAESAGKARAEAHATRAAMQASRSKMREWVRKCETEWQARLTSWQQ